MCFVLGVATDRFAILAADTRFTYRGPEGEPQALDWGGKLLRVRNGWVSGCGHGPLMLLALDSLRGVDASDLASVQRRLSSSYGRQAEAIRARHPDAGDRHAHVFLVRDGRPGFTVEIIRTDGLRVQGGAGHLMNWPPEIGATDAEPQRLAGELSREYRRPGATALGVLRRVAEIHAHCAAAKQTVSLELEVGLLGGRGGYLRLTGRDCINAPAAQLLKQFHDGSETEARLGAALSMSVDFHEKQVA